MSGLPKLVKGFDEALAEIRELGIEVLGLTTGTTSSHLAGMQLGETATDVLASGRAVRDAHRVAVPAYIKAQRSAETEFVVDDTHFLAQTEELERLRIEFKAWLFFVRALCDNAYRLLIANATGQGAPSTGSMSSALGPKNAEKPVTRLLTREAPGFLDWFETFRDLRDEVKRGAACGFTRVDAHGLELSTYTLRVSRQDGEAYAGLKIARTMTLADVVESARRIVQVLTVVVSTSPPSRGRVSG